MALSERVMDDLKAAMREGDEVARDTLRMLRSELGRAELEKGGALADADELAVVARAVKTRRESIEQYRAGGRDDLADTEAREVEVLERYLPRTLDREETRAAVEAAIAETGAAGKKDLGLVMKAAMAKHRGAIDGKLAKELAGELLG